MLMNITIILAIRISYICCQINSSFVNFNKYLMNAKEINYPIQQTKQIEMLKQLKYKKISLQQLEQRNQVKSQFYQKKVLYMNMVRRTSWIFKPYLLFQSSAISNHVILNKNGIVGCNHFFQAFKHAYGQHGDVVLVPDQIWIMISFYLSTYIDRNAQKLRHKLVKNEGQITLTIQETVSSKQQSLLAQKNWDNFFEKIIQKIKQNTVKGVVQNFECNFSTTNKLYKTISTSIIMNSLKTFFKYKRAIRACGINNVYMAGIREDWVKIIQKLENLVQYDVDGVLKMYILHMRIILSKFLDTFDQKPDLQWWNCVMKSPQKRKVYGGQQTQVDGWILNFFGMYDRSKILQFPSIGIKVPITLVNQYTNTEKQLALVSDWVSVSKLNDRAYKPDVGLSIIEISQKVAKQM